MILVSACLLNHQVRYIGIQRREKHDFSKCLFIKSSSTL